MCDPSLVTDSAMTGVLEEIERLRPNSTIPHYPPFAAWGACRGSGRVFGAWREALRHSASVGLNVHVPFCRTVCSFCNVEPRRTVRREGRNILSGYLRSLEAEARMYSGLFKDFKFSSLYVGGGTPNILEPDQIRKLFAVLDGNFNFVPGSQRVCEAIPDFLDDERLSALRDAAITCLAVGVQSLDDAVIRESGRTQDNSLVEQRCRNAANYGIGRLLVDLITGLPGQSEESFLRDVRAVASWRPDDIYLGEFNPVNTRFERKGGRITDAGRKACALSLKKGLSILRRMGYHHKGEESYATLDPRSQNWRGFHPFFSSDSLLGLGPGAVSHAWGSLRYSNTKDLKTYAGKLRSHRLPVARVCGLTIRREMIHFVLDSLERGWVSRRDFLDEFGKDIDKCFGLQLEHLLGKGVLKRTVSGYRILDFDHGAYAVSKELFEPAVVRSILKRIRGKNVPHDKR